MSYFNRSYARGVAQTLLDAGYLNPGALEKVASIADFVGDNFTFDVTEGRVPPQYNAEIAQAILKIAGDEGALVTGDKPEQANTPENAASQVGGAAALDQGQRPEGKYLEGVGKTQLDTSAGEVGKLQKVDHPAGPVTDAANSVNKEASVTRLLRKLAEATTGSLITGGNSAQANTPENAAMQVGGMAALDQMQRPQGQYLVGVGNTSLQVPSGAVVGKEMPHPEAAAHAGEVQSNSIIEATKSAAYNSLFEITAKEVFPHLPTKLSDLQKVAAIKNMMGMDGTEKRAYLTKIAEHDGLPAFILDKMDKKDGDKDEDKKDAKKDEKPEDKKDEKKEDEPKKEAGARMNVHNLLAGLQAVASRR